jgi:5-methylcytosine-specific restriction protein A
MSRVYDTRAWRDRIRPSKLRRNPVCEEAGCGRPATEVDHANGNPSDNSPENLRAYCKAHHSEKTARENGSFGRQHAQGRRARYGIRGCFSDGSPRDPTHPAYTGPPPGER